MVLDSVKFKIKETTFGKSFILCNLMMEDKRAREGDGTGGYQTHFYNKHLLG
jgi:hypothetical protein